MVPNLQRRYRLPEQQGNRTEICVSAGPEAVTQLRRLLGREPGVLHIPQMGLVVRLPAMDGREELRWELQREGDKVIQGIEHLAV